MSISFLATSTNPELVEEIVLLQDVSGSSLELINAIAKQRKLTRTLRTSFNDEDCKVEISHTNYLDDVGFYCAHLKTQLGSDYATLELYEVTTDGFQPTGRKTLIDRSILNPI